MQAIPMVGFIFVNTHQTPPLVALFGPRLFMMDGERGDDYEDYDDFGLVSRGRGWRSAVTVKKNRTEDGETRAVAKDRRRVSYSAKVRRG